MILKTWSEVLAQSFQDLWLGVISFVPAFVGVYFIKETFSKDLHYHEQ